MRSFRQESQSQHPPRGQEVRPSGGPAVPAPGRLRTSLLKPASCPIWMLVHREASVSMSGAFSFQNETHF